MDRVSVDDPHDAAGAGAGTAHHRGLSTVEPANRRRAAGAAGEQKYEEQQAA